MSGDIFDPDIFDHDVIKKASRDLLKHKENTMKNKDGIEIKVGQVWATSQGKERTVLCFNNQGEPVMEKSSGIVYRLFPSDFEHWLHTLISDPDQPWLPLPGGYRLVTDEERGNNDKISSGIVKMWNGVKWYAANCPYVDWISETHYAVPESFTFEPEKPKYKLFEIDWAENDHPCIWENQEMETGFLLDAKVGYLVDGYRIFGYTNCNPDNFDPMICTAYARQPCDHTGERKFAIGRLAD